MQGGFLIAFYNIQRNVPFERSFFSIFNAVGVMASPACEVSLRHAGREQPIWNIASITSSAGITLLIPASAI